MAAALFPFMRFDRPGPGVDPNEPRKKGFARWAEVSGRDLGPFWISGLIALLAMVPYFLGLYFAINSHLLAALAAACVLGGMLAGPFWSALMDVLLRSLRDEPLMWSYNWRDALRKNGRQSLLPGALCALVFGVQYFIFRHVSPGGPGMLIMALLLVGTVLTTGFFLWMWTLIPLFAQPFRSTAKNALLLTLGHPLPTLAGALICLGYLGLALAFSPVSMLVVFITNLWLPLSGGLMVIYRHLDKAFDLENAIRALHERQAEDQSGDGPSDGQDN